VLQVRATFGTWYYVCVNHPLTTFTPRTHNYNKLVLAQHLDDLVESFMMSFLHNGQVVSRCAHVMYAEILITHCSV
jgi:hypothetical protein